MLLQWDEPVLVTADIIKKREVLERVCTPIVTKPAPKPQPPPAAAAAADAAGDAPAPMDAEGEPAAGAAGEEGQQQEPEFMETS